MPEPRQPTSSAASSHLTMRGWPRRRRSRSSIPTCRSSTRTIICGAAGHRYLLHELLADSPPATTVGQRVPAMPLDVPRRRPGRDAAGRRDRIRHRHRRDERQRQLRQDARRRRHRRLRRPDAGRPRRAGAGSAYPRRRRAVPRRAPFGRWDADPIIGNGAPACRDSTRAPDFRAGLARLSRAWPVARCLGVPPAACRGDRPGPRLSRHQHHHGPLSAACSATGRMPASATRCSPPGRRR